MEICFSGDRNQQQERVKPWIKKPDYKDGWSRRRAARSEVGQTTEAPRARSRRQHSQQQLFFSFFGGPSTSQNPPTPPTPVKAAASAAASGGCARAPRPWSCLGCWRSRRCLLTPPRDRSGRCLSMTKGRREMNFTTMRISTRALALAFLRSV